MKTDCMYYVKLILRRGGRWRAKMIGETIVGDYGLRFQDSEILACLKSLIRDNLVLSAPVTFLGKLTTEFYVVEKPKKEAAIRVPLPIKDLIKRCKEVAEGYPDEHEQRSTIIKQCNELETRKGMCV